MCVFFVFACAWLTVRMKATAETGERGLGQAVFVRKRIDSYIGRHEDSGRKAEY